MLLLLVQGKLKNLTIEERLALSVSLKMFTRSIIIKRRVEDLQLAYSNPRGFTYQNKDKKNRLMHIDELHKFSDGTLYDVRSALDDILKRIWMEYLPQTVWRNIDREQKDYEEPGKFCWWETVRGRPSAARKDHMIYHMMHRHSNLMIQPEPEGSTQGYPLDSVEVLRFDTSAGNPVKEILLKLNLCDHRSILTDSKVTPTKHGTRIKDDLDCSDSEYEEDEDEDRSCSIKENHNDVLDDFVETRKGG
ncbi:hypothetical protein Tco_1428218 [Tanacetum coccineum]